MGRTTKPLTILVIGLPESPEFVELVASGHTVQYSNLYKMDLTSYDLILGPRCWRMDDPLLRLGMLPLAVQEGRLARYPKEDKA